jgi:hypothetical protein
MPVTPPEFIIYYCELAYDLDAQIAMKESTAAAQREWFLRHTHCTLTVTINPTLKVPPEQALVVKPAAGFSDPMTISKTDC